MLGNVYIRNYTISYDCIYLTQFDNTWNLLDFSFEGKKILICMLYWNVDHHLYVITFIHARIYICYIFVCANVYRFSVCNQTYIACVKSSSICTSLGLTICTWLGFALYWKVNIRIRNNYKSRFVNQEEF